MLLYTLMTLLEIAQELKDCFEKDFASFYHHYSVQMPQCNIPDQPMHIKFWDAHQTVAFLICACVMLCW